VTADLQALHAQALASLDEVVATRPAQVVAKEEDAPRALPEGATRVEALEIDRLVQPGDLSSVGSGGDPSGRAVVERHHARHHAVDLRRQRAIPDHPVAHEGQRDPRIAFGQEQRARRMLGDQRVHLVGQVALGTHHSHPGRSGELSHLAALGGVHGHVVAEPAQLLGQRHQIGLAAADRSEMMSAED
jgi:hypothetical protein